MGWMDKVDRLSFLVLISLRFRIWWLMDDFLSFLVLIFEFSKLMVGFFFSVNDEFGRELILIHFCFFSCSCRVVDMLWCRISRLIRWLPYLFTNFNWFLGYVEFLYTHVSMRSPLLVVFQIEFRNPIACFSLAWSGSSHFWLSSMCFFLLTGGMDFLWPKVLLGVSLLKPYLHMMKHNVDHGVNVAGIL